MKLEEILALVQAGYSKDEITAMGESPKEETTPKPEAKSEEPKPEPKEEPKENTQIDYAKLSMELMKAVAGMDTGHSPDHKTKEEKAEDAMLSFIK